MIKKNLFFTITAIFLVAFVGYLAFRVEAIHSQTTTIQNSIQSIKTEQEKISNRLFAAQNKSKKNYDKFYNVEIGDSIVLGNPDATVTVIKWTDFQCPYCAKSSSLVHQLLGKYPNEVKVVIKNFPLSSHKQAMAAAKYSIAAYKQGAYKDMYTFLFKHSKQLNNNPELPLTFAKDIGLDMVQFNKDANSTETNALIRAEMKQLQATGMRVSVPKFLINGKEPAPPRNIENWSKIIDQILKKAPKS